MENIDRIFEKIFYGKSLNENESYDIFGDIMEEKIPPVKTAVFLALLRMKGEQATEIAGAARLLRDKSTRIRVPGAKVICDTCGTGGDNAGTFNVSTCAAVTAFAAGLTVAKHGNRSVTSRCGSADVLEAAGYPIELPPGKSELLLNRQGFAFLYAPLYHRAMKSVAPVRKSLGFRTIFNVIGPLCNPAGANVQITGVSDYNLFKIMPAVFRMLGITGYIVHSADGIDEITLTGKTYVAEVSCERTDEFEVAPEDFGFEKCSVNDIKGGDARDNSEILMAVIENREQGPKKNIVILNTAFLLKAGGVVRNVKDGIEYATRVIDKGICHNMFSRLLEEAAGK